MGGGEWVVAVGQYHRIWAERVQKLPEATLVHKFEEVNQGGELEIKSCALKAWYEQSSNQMVGFARFSEIMVMP